MKWNHPLFRHNIQPYPMRTNCSSQRKVNQAINFQPSTSIDKVLLHRIPRDFCVLPLTDNLFCNFFLKSAIPVFCVFCSFSLSKLLMEGYLLYPVTHIDCHYAIDVLFDSRKSEDFQVEVKWGLPSSKGSQQPNFD